MPSGVVEGVDGAQPAETITLTYVVSVRESAKPADWKVFVDAITGDVVHKYNDIKFKIQRSSS